MASVAELEKAIAEQGEKVKNMKAAGEDVSAEVPKLLALKDQLPDDHPLKPKSKKDKKKKAPAPAPAPKSADDEAKAAKKAAEKEAKKAERKNKKASAVAAVQGGAPAPAPAPAPAAKAPAPTKGAVPSKSGAPRVFVTGTDHHATAIQIAAGLAKVEVVAQAAPSSHGAPLPASASVEIDGRVYAGNSTTLAYCCSASEQLRPRDAVEEAQVQQWLSFSNLALNGAPASAGPAHKELDAALLLRTFLAGEHLSAADIALYTAVHPMMSGSNQKIRAAHTNLNRWFEHVQHCVGAQSTLKPVAELAPEVSGPPGSAQANQAKPPAANNSKKADKAAAKADKKAAKADKPKKEKAPQPAVAENISRMDIRVGLVVKAEMHPESEKLFVETIDVGDEAGPRQILSGLGGLVPLEEMQGRRVVCICNLKTAKLAGMDSHGMVLCASHEPENGDKVCEPLAPPEGAKVGELITFEGYPSTPDAVLKKSKPWTEVAADLLTNDQGVACWNKIPFNTSAGACKITNVSALANKPIK